MYMYLLTVYKIMLDCCITLSITLALPHTLSLPLTIKSDALLEGAHASILQLPELSE